jgi:hypothetical protein
MHASADLDADLADGVDDGAHKADAGSLKAAKKPTPAVSLDLGSASGLVERCDRAAR